MLYFCKCHLVVTIYEHVLYENQANSCVKTEISCFGPFNKLDIHGFLCFSIIPEGEHLGRNDLGVKVPHKYLQIKHTKKKI